MRSVYFPEDFLSALTLTALIGVAAVFVILIILMLYDLKRGKLW